MPHECVVIRQFLHKRKCITLDVCCLAGALLSIEYSYSRAWHSSMNGADPVRLERHWGWCYNCDRGSTECSRWRVTVSLAQRWHQERWIPTEWQEAHDGPHCSYRYRSACCSCISWNQSRRVGSVAGSACHDTSLHRRHRYRKLPGSAWHCSDCSHSNHPQEQASHYRIL